MRRSNRQLCKFSGPTEYALQNLERGAIYCQHYSAYNDPFEFWTQIVEGIPDPECEPERFLAAVRAWGFDCRTATEAMANPIIRDCVGEYFDECLHYAPPFKLMRQSMRIACFGSERANLLMWSHYGDGLRGFCIVFDENLVENAEPRGYLLDVSYPHVPPNVDSFVYGVAWDQEWYSQTAIEETNVAIKYQGKTEEQAYIPLYEESGAEALRTMRNIWQHVFATKPTEWSYERERRLLVQTDRADHAPILRDFPKEAIKEVIVGERMPADFQKKLLSLLNQRYPNVEVKTARRMKDQYTITVD